MYPLLPSASIAGMRFPNASNTPVITGFAEVKAPPRTLAKSTCPSNLAHRSLISHKLPTSGATVISSAVVKALISLGSIGAPATIVCVSIGLAGPQFTPMYCCRFMSPVAVIIVFIWLLIVSSRVLIVSSCVVFSSPLAIPLVLIPGILANSFYS